MRGAAFASRAHAWANPRPCAFRDRPAVARAREANVAKGATPWRRCASAPPRVARARFAPRRAPRTLAASSRDDDDPASVPGETDARPADDDHDDDDADADKTSSSVASDDVHVPPLVPRTFAAIDDIVARAPTEAESAAALDAAKQAVLDATEPLPWHHRPADPPERNRNPPETRVDVDVDVDRASLDRDLGDPSDLGSNPSSDSASFFSFRGDSLEDAAFFLGWRVVDVNTGAVVGVVKHALAMAGGEVVAQLGDEEEDEHDAPAGDFFFSPGDEDDDEDDRDDDEDPWDDEEEEEEEDDWEVIYEGEDGDGISSLGSGEGDEWNGAASSSESFDSFDDDGAPPLSVVLRVRGEREVSGAGGAVNLTPVVHLVPLVAALFPRWNPETRTVVVDPPAGLYDLGTRQSEILALRRDLLPYCSSVSATEMGMPQRRTLLRADRDDLVSRVSALGDWSSVALMLGFESSRKPDGYWENRDLLRDALLKLIHAFWFEEVDEDTGQTFFYNDISGALSFEEPNVESGGGLDVPVMPAMADVLEARRWDVHQAILLHGGYKEVAAALGWMQKRTSENRHLLQFSALAREMEGFIEESAEELGIPEGRFPSEGMLLECDRDDLVQGVKWHGGFVRVARRMGRLNYHASKLTEVTAAAKAFKEFASEQRAKTMDEANDRKATTKTRTTTRGDDKIARLLDTPVMPTESELLGAGRHDMRWALRIHNRERLAEEAGLADPNRANPATGKPLKMRLGYAEARRFMRAQKPRLASARRFRDWSAEGNRPWFIPADPKAYYSERDAWVTWEDFLGTPKPAPGLERVRAFRSYDAARRYMRELRRDGARGGTTVIERGEGEEEVAVVAPPPNTSSEYKTWASSGAKPKDIPRDPVATYGRRGEWVSWDDYLGRKPSDARRRPRAKSRAKR